jgi:hypothetical protein
MVNSLDLVRDVDELVVGGSQLGKTPAEKAPIVVIFDDAVPVNKHWKCDDFVFFIDLVYNGWHKVFPFVHLGRRQTHPGWTIYMQSAPYPAVDALFSFSESRSLYSRWINQRIYALAVRSVERANSSSFRRVSGSIFMAKNFVFAFRMFDLIISYC